MAQKIIDHPYFKTLAELSRDLIELHDSNYSVIRNGYTPTRKLSPAEGYVRTALLSGGELANICAQLHQSVTFLTNFRSTPNLKKQKIDRHDHILYHLESHLIRATSCHDRCLILVNDIFLLGNSPRNCTPNIILKNKYISESPVIEYLKELDKHIRPFRQNRNLVIHRESYKHDDLRKIEASSILEKAGDEVVPWHYSKRIADEFVSERKKELTAFNTKLFKIIDKLLNELLTIFRKKHKVLLNGIIRYNKD